MFEYQKTNRYFAQITGGLEESGAQELEDCGASSARPAFRGIFFEADKATLYRINYTGRLITRVLAPLVKFQCHSTRYLYNKASQIDWSRLFTVNQTFAIFSNVANSRIRHSQYAGLKLKDAIVDYFRDHFQQRPNIEKTNPDIWISLHIENDWATISFDTSNGSLHRRGYRKESVEAPMQETVAAAIIRMSQWNGEKPLYDPMCGAGTLLTEAVMSYCQIPAGYLRKKFGFENLPDFDSNIWQTIKKEADKKIRSIQGNLVSGSDISKQAIDAANMNISTLPVNNHIRMNIMDFNEIENLEDIVIVCNPPYGIRLGDKRMIGGLYKKFGDFLKQRCKGSVAFIYFGDRKLIPLVGLKTAWKKPLSNGGLDGRLAKFEIY